ncbi:nucleoside triphosphate pyrophosphatase [Rheinheimera sp.]|uniref:Maf family protein n=1 Tax=Rheinheimera sp. TaxID=1869214 RepID=UPI0027B9C7F3|nr:Maf family protein [Rheinheimera sp.]
MSQNLWLASTSIYRKALLEKLTPDFQTAKPEVDETALPGETATALVERLAIAKAKAVADKLKEGLVIGSDQVALFDGDILGKPHTADNAFLQLKRFSGHKVTFLTGLAVVDAATGNISHCVEPFYVHFRHLTDDDINTYIKREQPLNCAGSFKSEGLGITLFSKLEGDDPNSLIGLPLIKLHQLLKQQGRDLLLQP